MSGVETRQVRGDESGMRLDRWFRHHYPHVTQGRLQKLLRSGQVRVDGGRVKANVRLETGQAVRIPPLPDKTGEPSAEQPKQVSKREADELRSLVIYRDHHVIALNKPHGLAVQGGSGTRRHLDGMLDVLKFDAEDRPRLVHRLDRDTSGLLLLARTRKAATFLSAAFKGHDVVKTYWALVAGVPRPERGTIDVRLAKTGHAGEQRVRPVERSDPNGQKAVTHYVTLASAAPAASWLALRPETGRTHQLRAHMAAIGHPIIGDGKYGDRSAEPGGEISSRLHLHARSLSLPNPAGGRLDLECPLPEHMAKTWAFLGLDTEVDGDPFEEFSP